MIISIPESVQRDPKNRIWKHLNAIGLDWEFQDSDMDERFVTWFHYALPTATADDALILKLKFHNCRIRHFSL